MPDIAGAIKAFFETVGEVFRWKTGGRTKDENVIRDETQHWREEYVKAIRGGDVEYGSFCLHNLRRLRDQARAAGA
jgi:hypothetical protein